MKNHIFFSHYLALRRKCGKRVGIFCRNSAAVLAGHGLPLPLQRKNQSSPDAGEFSEKCYDNNQTSPTVVRQHGTMSRHQEKNVNASTDNERSEKRGFRGRAPSADTPKGSRPDLHGRRRATATPKTMRWNGSYPRWAKK